MPSGLTGGAVAGPAVGPPRPQAELLSARASLSDGLAARSDPARAPARARKKPAAPIMAALSVHNPGRGHDDADAALTGVVLDRGRGARSSRPLPRRPRSCARHSPRPRAGSSRQARRRLTPGSRRPARPRPSRTAAGLGAHRSDVSAQLARDLAPSGGLEAAEREVERIAQPGARKDPIHDALPRRLRA